MARPSRYRLLWARWLVYQDLPRAHVCALIGIDQAELEALLAVRQNAQFRPGPPARPFGSSILGETGTKVRILDSLGYDPGRIAAILAIRRADVVDFLARSRPLRTPKNGSGELARPRTPAEQKRIKRRKPKPQPRPVEPTPWTYRDQSPRQDLAEPPAPAIVAAELPELDQAEPRDETPPAIAPPPAPSPGAWGADYGRRPHVHPAAAEILELRALGWSREDLAERFGCSVATIDRATRGQRHGQPLRSVTPEQAAEICGRRARGERCDHLAEEYGVGADTITRILQAGRRRGLAPPPAVELDQAVPELPAAEPPPPPAPSPVPAAADDAWKYFGGSKPTPGRRKAPVEAT